MKYKGMTVNERLYASGLMNDFEKAVDNKDIDKVKAMLKQVELDEASIEPILKSLRLL